MNAEQPTMESQLAAALCSQDRIYQQANQLMEPVPDMIARQQDVGGIMNQLQGLMSAAAENEKVLRHHWQTWKASGRTAPAELQSSWSQTETSLKQLVQQIDSITQRAQTARDTLIPSVQTTANHHQMRQAYSQG